MATSRFRSLAISFGDAQRQPEDQESSPSSAIGSPQLRQIRNLARLELTRATESIFCSLVRAWCCGLERRLSQIRNHRLRSSSSAATSESADSCLWKYFNHGKGR